MKKRIQLIALLTNNGIIEKTDLVISGAFKTEDDDYYCTVNIPNLFENEKVIYGIDEAQAKQLAISFVKQVLDVNAIVDIHEKPVDFSSLADDFVNK